jgi:hypothetical protein
MAIADFKTKLADLVLTDKFLQFVHPIPLEVALSGEPGTKGFDPINPKTSMGFWLNSPKWKFFAKNKLEDITGLDTVKFVTQEVVDGKTIYKYTIEFDKEKFDVEAELEEVLEKLADGRRANLIFRLNLKDEPITHKKAEDNKVRAFAGAPVTMVILCRMLTLPLINMMSHFPGVFESAVGIDATGADWEWLHNFMKEFGADRCGDGDFEKFDAWLRANFTKGAFDIIRTMLEKAGFGELLISAFDGLATECMFPIYESDGLIYEAFGSNPSGHSLTVIINGLCNVLYMRYVYYSLHKVDRPGVIPLFHEMVRLMTYGDDNAFNVKPEEKLFNMQSIHAELAKIGVGYTDANKKKPEVPFKKLEDLSFLKRSFHKHPQLKKVVGALEKESIFKSLSMTHKPKKGQKESMAEICASNLNGALRELYFHGADEYYKYLPVFCEIARETKDPEGHKVIDYFKPFTEDEIREQYERTSCTYDKALEALECQAGEVDDIDMTDCVPSGAAYTVKRQKLRRRERFYQEWEIEFGVKVVDRWMENPFQPLPHFVQGDLTYACIDCARKRFGLGIIRKWVLIEEYFMYARDVDFIRYHNMTMGYDWKYPTFQALREWSYGQVSSQVIYYDGLLLYRELEVEVRPASRSYREQYISSLLAFHAVAALAIAGTCIDITSAAEAFCGEEMVPIADTIYAHCNDSTGYLSWEWPLTFKILGLFPQIAFHYLFAKGRIKISIQRLSFTQQVFLLQIAMLGGFKWLFTQFLLFVYMHCVFTGGMVFYDHVTNNPVF